MVNGKKKGSAGERELAAKFREHGLTARRTQQFCGAAGDADVDCAELSMFHIECKRVERLNIDQAMEQAERDCYEKTPIVCHRRNNKPWMVTMLLDDWISLVTDAEQTEL
jgi:Holliday junction resolvase